MATKHAAFLAREAYPGYVLFEQRDDEGIVWLQGKDLIRAKTILGLESDASSIGFHVSDLPFYVGQLMEKGIRVGILRGNTVRTIEPNQVRKSKETPKYTTIGLAPVLIVGQKEINRLLQAMKREGFEQLVARIREATNNNTNGLSEYGALYVYQVAVDTYEIDEDLTTIPQDLLKAVLVASHLDGKMLHCRLVLPKPKRSKKGARPRPLFMVSEPVTYGQLRFPI